MHPILAQGQRRGLYLVLFLQAGLLLGELLARTTGAPRLQAMLLVVPLVLFHGFTCLASWYLCKSLPLGETRLERLLIALLAAGLTAAGTLLLIGFIWAILLDRFTPLTGHLTVLQEGFTLIFVFGLLLYSLAVAVHYLLGALERSHAAEGHAYELRLLAQEAELRALKAQVDPHFLFNSLNSINALVGSDPLAARLMCTRLADFLRRSLRLGTVASIRLAEEIDLVDAYLAIEQVRFGDRLRVERTLAPGCGECTVPPLLLQPLAENAVRHGIAHRIEGGIVSIRAERRGGRLLLEVENPCDPDRPILGDGGIGLGNVRLRLAAAFGEEASLQVCSEVGSFRVELLLPALTAGERA